MPNYSRIHPKNMIGEVPLSTLFDLEKRIKDADPEYELYFYSGSIIIKKEGRGRPFKTSSINKLIEFVEKLELKK